MLDLFDHGNDLSSPALLSSLIDSDVDRTRNRSIYTADLLQLRSVRCALPQAVPLLLPCWMAATRTLLLHCLSHSLSIACLATQDDWRKFSFAKFELTTKFIIAFSVSSVQNRPTNTQDDSDSEESIAFLSKAI